MKTLKRRSSGAQPGAEVSLCTGDDFVVLCWAVFAAGEFLPAIMSPNVGITYPTQQVLNSKGSLLGYDSLTTSAFGPLGSLDYQVLSAAEWDAADADETRPF